MSLKERIEEDLKSAIKAQNKDEIRALRGIKSLILLAGTEKGAASSLTPEAEIALLTKAAKQRKDSAQLYEKQSREDLAQIENAELEIIAKYLPEQLSEEALREQLQAIILQMGASGLADMGKVMGKANMQLKGKADGATMAKIVKSILTAGL